VANVAHARVKRPNMRIAFAFFFKTKGKKGGK
jgi:hypothetical protein